MPELPVTPIAVVGPTASGKSDLGIALARELGGEVVNVDSMQLYRGMDIGTAKLPPAERGGIPHHLLDIWEVTRTASVAEYQARACEVVEEIAARGTVPILVGGSMMYVQSLIDDWQFPPTDPAVRAKYEARQAEIGVQALHAELMDIDPQAASIIEDIIGLRTNAEWLNPRIEKRTQLMFDRGFVDEVRTLIDAGLVPDSTAGRAIGYAQVLDYLAGGCTLAEAVESTITGTRRYVRRQRSWFNRDKRIAWVDADQGPEALLRAALDSLA